MTDSLIRLPRRSTRHRGADWPDQATYRDIDPEWFVPDRRPTTLHGRRSECEVLGGLLDGVRGGRSAVLVLRGEAGVGKTALLDYAVASAAGLRVVRATGVESEMELAFAARRLMMRSVPVLVAAGAGHRLSRAARAGGGRPWHGRCAGAAGLGAAVADG
jgi:hypothetical protein